MKTNHGESLRDYIRDEGLSRSEAASKIGIAPDSLSRKYKDEIFSHKFITKLKESIGLDLAAKTYRTIVVEGFESIKDAAELKKSGDISEEDYTKLKDSIIDRLLRESEQDD